MFQKRKRDSTHTDLEQMQHVRLQYERRNILTYKEALSYIHSVSWKGSKPGLTRITELMNRLGDPQKELKYIHIVGTNGKGSTAAMLSSVLSEAGYRTGLFTSPYITCFRERMQINGVMISEQELAKTVQAVRCLAEQMADKPTEFEFITAVALVWFAKQRCDIVVMEAGMGGELDSTNVIPAPEIAVFTNIGLDHTEYLGDTVEQIAQTKAGILKSDCQCVLYPNLPSVEQVISEACAKQDIPLYQPDFSKIAVKSQTLAGQKFDYQARENLKLSLLGTHQLCNAAVVLTVIDCLVARKWHITEEAIYAGLQKTEWPGRLEVLCEEPLFLLDGGHNPQCIQALCRAIQTYLPEQKLLLVTGVLADKDYSAMYEQIMPLTAASLTLTPPNPRAMPAAQLAEYLRRYDKPVTVCDTVYSAVQTAIDMARAQNMAVLACGSLYMAGQIRACFKA